MLKYILKRIIMMIPVILGVLTIVFLLNSLTPGDPAQLILGGDYTEEAYVQLREEMGLDQPVIIRYVNYIVNFFTKFDLGTSYVTKQPIRAEILTRWGPTCILAFSSIALAILIGMSLGVISAVKQYSAIDNISMGLSMTFVSVPNFWLALMLILLFSVELKWLPASGISNKLGWILPIVTLAICSSANIARTTRSSMLEVIRQDYIDTAKAKGLSEWTIIIRHAVRNALLPIITQIGIQVGVQLGGVLAIEQVFGIPGLGTYIITAINGRDYPAIQGCVVFLAIVFSFVNLAVDIVYTFVDPRLKDSFKMQSSLKKNQKLVRELTKQSRLAAEQEGVR